MRFFKKDLISNNYSKLLIVFLAAILVAPLSVVAQNEAPRIGVKGGVNLSNLYVDDVDDENARAGFQFGLTSKFPLAEFVAIQPEVLYTQKGAKVSRWIGGVEKGADFRLNYIEVPILVVFNLGRYFNIHAGVYGSYLLGVNIDDNDNFFELSENVDKGDFQTIDYGLSGGIGFNFTEAIGLGIRYDYGLRGVGDNSIGAGVRDAKNSVAQFYLTVGL